MRIQSVPSDSVDVLIVEDDALTRETLRLLLEWSGYRCVEARNGQQALVLARGEPPRCVLLDLTLRDLDGFTVARRLRADLRTFGMHIHCLAGSQSQRIREQAQRAGFEEFLTKPVDGNTLLEVVGRELKREDKVRATVVSGLAKTQAETMVDWLKGQHCTGLAIRAEEDGFVVRCVPPHGFHLALKKGPLCLVQPRKRQTRRGSDFSP